MWCRSVLILNFLKQETFKYKLLKIADTGRKMAAYFAFDI